MRGKVDAKKWHLFGHMKWVPSMSKKKKIEINRKEKDREKITG
jgi:hypothetical protein